MYDGRRRATLILAVAAAVAACMAVVPTASAAPARPAGGAQRLAAGNPWGTAQEVPGTAVLNKGRKAEITSVSCASAGNCSASGDYQDGSNITQAFVVSEVGGTWRKAEEVPGVAALSKGHKAEISSVSCGSAGNCSAGGWYRVGSGGSFRQEVFVVSEVRGRWRKAEEVPGTAALNKERHAAIASVSCASAGNCSAGGYYAIGHPDGVVPATQAFVVSEVRGRWRKAEEMPGIAALTTSGFARITSVSCGSAGSCSAGGYYGSGVTGAGGAFVVSEVRGRWRKAETVPGLADLNLDPYSAITSVSCASASSCSAGGRYFSRPSLYGQAFVVSEVSGTWGTAEEVPGTAALNTGGSAQITSVSCASAGNCGAGGRYTDGSHFQAFVVSEVNGTWQTAEQVPGTAALNTAQITSVSCGLAGHCSAGGQYTSAGSGRQAFVASQK